MFRLSVTDASAQNAEKCRVVRCIAMFALPCAVASACCAPSVHSTSQLRPCTPSREGGGSSTPPTLFTEYSISPPASPLRRWRVFQGGAFEPALSITRQTRLDTRVQLAARCVRSCRPMVRPIPCPLVIRGAALTAASVCHQSCLFPTVRIPFGDHPLKLERYRED